MEALNEKTLDYSAYAKSHELNNAAALIRNMAENYLTVKRIMDRRQATIPLFEEYGGRGPAIVTASGPSLTEAMPYLRELRDKLGAKIFAGVSQTWALEEAKVRPDYVTTNDMWPDTTRYMPRTNELKRAAKRITPIAHPGVWREFLHWPGMKDNGLLFFVRQVEERAPAEEEPLTEVEETVLMGMRRRYLSTIVSIMAGLLYSGNNPEVKHPIGAQLYLAPDTALQAAMIATTMGHDPIYLVGYDQCFWKGKNRARTVTGDGRIYESDSYDAVAEKTESGFGASKNMLYYRTFALIYQARINMRLVEVVVDGTPGNLQYLPRAPLEDLLTSSVEIPSREDMMLTLKVFFKKFGLVK